MVSHTFSQHHRIILYREAGTIIYELFQFFFLIQSPSSRQNKLPFKETNFKSGNTLGKAKGLPSACYLGPACSRIEWESNVYFVLYVENPEILEWI